MTLACSSIPREYMISFGSLRVDDGQAPLSRLLRQNNRPQTALLANLSVKDSEESPRDLNQPPISPPSHSLYVESQFVNMVQYYAIAGRQVGSHHVCLASFSFVEKLFKPCLLQLIKALPLVSIKDWFTDCFTFVSSQSEFSVSFSVAHFCQWEDHLRKRPKGHLLMLKPPTRRASSSM